MCERGVSYSALSSFNNPFPTFSHSQRRAKKNKVTSQERKRAFRRIDSDKSFCMGEKLLAGPLKQWISPANGTTRIKICKIGANCIPGMVMGSRKKIETLKRGWSEKKRLVGKVCRKKVVPLSFLLSAPYGKSFSSISSD